MPTPQSRRADTEQHPERAAAGIQQHIPGAGPASRHEILVEFITGRREEDPRYRQQASPPPAPHPLAQQCIHQNPHARILREMGQLPDGMLESSRQPRHTGLAPVPAGQGVEDIHASGGNLLAQGAGLLPVLGGKPEDDAVQSCQQCRGNARHHPSAQGVPSHLIRHVPSGIPLSWRNPSPACR